MPPNLPARHHRDAALFGLLLLGCIAIGCGIAAAARWLAPWLPL